MSRQREAKAAVSHVKCTDFYRAIIRHQHLVGQLRSVYPYICDRYSVQVSDFVLILFLFSPG